MQFEFIAPARIVFGPGSAREIPPMVLSLDERPCLVMGSDPSRVDWLTQALEVDGIPPLAISVSGEPEIDYISLAAEKARQEGCGVVVAVGGGSVIDAGKALAALLTNTAPLLDYLEVVGKSHPLENPPAPCIAVPTTAGTGAEATTNAVLLSPEHRVKVSMRHPAMLPDVAVVDPELALSLPPGPTASTGMDALTQLLEAFVSPFAQPMTSALCRDGLDRAARNLHRAFADGENLAARENMALAALYSGLALTNAKLGAVHGFAAPLGAMLKAPHGAVCAALLPQVMEANIRALQRGEGKDAADTVQALAVYEEAARILTGDPGAQALDGAAWVRDLCSSLSISGLGSMGLDRDRFAEAAKKASRASSMKGNPVKLSLDELQDILEKSL